MCELDLSRYQRHIILSGIGKEGQEKICKSKVLIVGVGGLGSPVALYLAAAGVGTIGLIDGDVVDETNLQRQIIHDSETVGLPKVESAKKRILELNPMVSVETYHSLFTEENAGLLVSKYDFIVSATDNFSSKYLVSDTCVALGKPFSHAGIVGYSGQLFTYKPGAACLRCIFPEEPDAATVPTCSTIGVLGPAVGVVGSLQAVETLKYLSGQHDGLLLNQVLYFDANQMVFRKMKVVKNTLCASCGQKK